MPLPESSLRLKVKAFVWGSSPLETLILMLSYTALRCGCQFELSALMAIDTRVNVY